MIVGAASLYSIGRGSTTSISVFARPDQHRRQLGEGARPRLEANALRALPGVVELEDVLLGGGILGHDLRRGQLHLGMAFALQELERHGTSNGLVAANPSSAGTPPAFRRPTRTHGGQAAPSRPARRASSRMARSASSASRVRAPSTTARGALPVKRSSASRARIAASWPSVSASSFSSRMRSRAAVSAWTATRTHDRLQVPGDDGEAAARVPVQGPGIGHAGKWARPGEPLEARAQCVEGGCERRRDRHVDREPGARLHAGLGARVADRPDEVEKRAGLRVGLRINVARNRPAPPRSGGPDRSPPWAADPRSPRSGTASPGAAAAGTCPGPPRASTMLPRDRRRDATRRSGAPWRAPAPSRSTPPRSRRRAWP